MALVSGEDGAWRLEIDNRSGKLGRVQSVETRGFEKELLLGGVPVFPTSRRLMEFSPGQRSQKAEVKVVFEDGFTITVPAS